MGNRLSRIVTRTGDAGETGLGTGARIAKDAPRIDSLGEVDELNSSLGVLLAEELPDALRKALIRIQHDLFDLGGELCLPGTDPIITDETVERLEGWAEDFNADLPPLKEFILPGGTRAAALAHLSRAICRRAERCVVHLARQEGEQVGDNVRRYLNRLSDLLFIAGRYLNRVGGKGDVLWQHERGKKQQG